MGTAAFEACEGDQVSLHARLAAPCYSYLLSFRPDGQMELCSPTRDTERPASTPSPSIPPGRMIDLNNGTGLEVFALVGSRDPLPDFRAWRAQQGPAPWRASIAGDLGVVWRYNGNGTPPEPLRAADGERVRGADARARGVMGTLTELVRWLESRPGVDIVILKAFAVQPPCD
jgi:hypothetical protein